MMRELEATTKMATLKDLGTWRGGGTPSKSNPAFWAEGTIPWVTPKDMKVFRIGDSEDCITPEAVDQSSASLVSGPSVAVVVRSGILQRTLPVAVVQLDATFNQDMKALQPKDGVRPEYVAYYLRGFERDILASCSKNGTTVASIDFARFHAYPIPLPSFEEQKQIVDEIETQFARLDDAVAALQRARTRLKRYRASVLKAACEGRLVPTEAELARQEGRDYEPASVLLESIRAEREANAGKKRGKVKTAPSGDSDVSLYLDHVASKLNDQLPDGWQLVRLQELANSEPSSITDGPFGSNLKSAHYTDSGPRVIRLQNIGDNKFHNHRAHISFEHFERLRKHNVMEGDIIVAVLGAPLPRSCIVPSGVSPAIVKADCIRIRIDSAVAHPSFVNYVLNSRSNRDIASVLVHGVGRPRLNLKTLKRLPLRLPPLAEQARIIAEVERRLSLIEQLEATVEANLKRAESLRQSILRMAFSRRLDFTNNHRDTSTPPVLLAQKKTEV